MSETKSNLKPRPYRQHLGVIEEKLNTWDGQFVLMIQEDIEKPHLNPENITGKLLWYTKEGGYDYCHPYSRAKERAEKLALAYNEYDELKKQVASMLEVIKEVAAWCKVDSPQGEKALNKCAEYCLTEKTHQQ